jgi:hypothetical protein
LFGAATVRRSPSRAIFTASGQHTSGWRSEITVEIFDTASVVLQASK